MNPSDFSNILLQLEREYDHMSTMTKKTVSLKNRTSPPSKAQWFNERLNTLFPDHAKILTEDEYQDSVSMPNDAPDFEAILNYVPGSFDNDQ